MVDWLKLLHTFPRNPKLRLLARRLKCHKLTAQGLAVQWLIFVDEQTTDGCTHLTVEEMDDELGFRGGAAALCEIGWASLDGDGCMVASEFGKHCGATAKKRAEDAARQGASRERKKLRSARDECHEKNVTSVTQKALPEKEEEYMHTKGVSKATVSSVCEPVALPPPPDGFPEWLAALCQAHPSARQSRVLAPDVLAEARAAFVRCPQAVQQAELLRAYLGDRMQEDRYRHPFYRPTGQAKFFEHLEDVLAHAERWARESGWSRRRKKSAAAPSTPAPSQQEATPQQKEEFLRGLREVAGDGYEK